MPPSKVTTVATRLALLTGLTGSKFKVRNPSATASAKKELEIPMLSKPHRVRLTGLTGLTG